MKLRRVPEIGWALDLFNESITIALITYERLPYIRFYRWVS